jgi:hypothetical protein
VVLPQPDGPKSVKNSPFLMFCVSCGIIVKSPYRLTTLSAVMATLIALSSIRTFYHSLACFHFIANKNNKQSKIKDKYPKK